MEVILLERVSNLGDLGDKVNVKSGFGRNFLIPYGKAVPATKENLADFEARRAELEAAAAGLFAKAEARGEELADKQVTIPANAGDEGRLFGSIGTRDIAEALTASVGAVTKSEVRMPHGVIREVGEYEIGLQLHSDVSVTVTVSVVPED